MEKPIYDFNEYFSSIIREQGRILCSLRGKELSDDEIYERAVRNVGRGRNERQVNELWEMWNKCKSGPFYK